MPQPASSTPAGSACTCAPPPPPPPPAVHPLPNPTADPSVTPLCAPTRTPGGRGLVAPVLAGGVRPGERVRVARGRPVRGLRRGHPQARHGLRHGRTPPAPPALRRGFRAPPLGGAPQRRRGAPPAPAAHPLLPPAGPPRRPRRKGAHGPRRGLGARRQEALQAGVCQRRPPGAPRGRRGRLARAGAVARPGVLAPALRAPLRAARGAPAAAAGAADKHLP